MRLFHLIKKEFIEIFRQKELLPLIFIAPIIQIIILGYVVKTDVKNIPVEIINLTSNRHAARIIKRISHTPLFRVIAISRENRNTVETLKRGNARAVIIFKDPPRQNPLNTPDIQINLDGIDSNTSLIAAGYFNGIIKKYLLENLEKKGAGRTLVAKPLIRFNPTLESINYMGPGIVALLLTIISLFFTSISIVREKEQQTMDTLLISQLTPMEIYLGKAIPTSIIGLINMGLGIAVVMLWFRVPVRGNLIYLLLASLIFLSALLSYALLISIIAGTQQQALFFAWFTMLTFMLLSGLFTPIENIPPGMRILADINPIRYLIKIIREIFLKGNGIEYFYRELLYLLGIATVAITASVLNFKRLISQ